MSDYTFFTVEQYDKVSVLTWTERAGSPVLQDGQLQVELQALVLTAKPGCVVVSFARLAHCSSSLIGRLIGLNRQLKERGSRLHLCEMDRMLREQFERLNLHLVFEIHGPLSDAVAACEEGAISGSQHG